MALAGCNGGGDGDNKTGGNGIPDSPSAPVATLFAQNATFSAPIAERYVVDLSDKVVVSDSSDFVLRSVEPITPDAACTPLEVLPTSFVISAEHSKACDYLYQVGLASEAASMAANHSVSPASSMTNDVGITRVAVSSEESTASVDLPAISAVTLIEQQVEVDVRVQLMQQAMIDVGSEFVLSEVISLPYTGHTASVK